MLDDRPSKIIVSWVIIFIAIGVYWATKIFMLSVVILMCAAPFRVNLYADESLQAATEELPVLSKVCATLSALFALYFVYDVAVNENQLMFHSVTFVLAPIGVVYFYRDVLYFKDIKNSKR